MAYHKNLSGANLHESKITILMDTPVALGLVASAEGIMVCDHLNRLWKSNSTNAGDWSMSPHVPVTVTNEVPGGLIDGYNSAFTTAFVPIEASEAVYLNGLRQSREDDYTIDGSDIVFVDPPLADDVVKVDYRYLD